MATIVETRDPYTAGHQHWVAQIAKAIAKQMDLSEDQVQSVWVAASVHDIGKISVPSEILAKPGLLTEIEFSLIKSHSQVGINILKNIDFPWPIAEIVHQHHERMDGSGYPCGLSGKDIMLEARIIGIADVVEAIATGRPYRAAYGIEKSLEEMLAYKSIRYDANVVEACIQIYQN